MAPPGPLWIINLVLSLSLMGRICRVQDIAVFIVHAQRLQTGAGMLQDAVFNSIFKRNVRQTKYWLCTVPRELDLV